MKIFKSKQEIAEGVAKAARAIEQEYQGLAQDDPLLCVCVLKGAVHFFSDLVREVKLNVELDFVRTSSYGMGRESSGEVRFLKDVETTIIDRSILIVEDIVESGLSLDFLRKHFLAKGARDVKIAALVDKPMKRKYDVPILVRVFEAQDQFLVGYGMDDGEKYRELPDLYYVD